jgi:hypothetical protein
MGTKQFDSATDLITFTRASGGTFLGSNGLLQTATNNTPRIEYNADGTAKGLLIEEARTNLVTYSEDFTDASWTKTGLTAASASEIGPDGQASMSTITVSATTSAHEMLQGARSVSANTIISGSFVVRAGTVRYVSVRLYSFNGIWSVAVFDLTTGTLTQESNGTTSGTILNSGIESLPNGLYRLSLTATNSYTKSYLIAQVHNTGTPTLNTYGGDTWLGAGETIELGFMQHEVGSFPTSYIPTTGSTATRAADVASIPTSAFGYNQKAGTVVVNGVSSHKDGDSAVFYLYENTSNFIGAKFSNHSVSNSIQTRVVSSGATAQLFPTPAPANTSVNYAVGLATNNVSAVIDGGTIASDNVVDLFAVSQMSIGYRGPYNDLPLNGHIKSIQYYPRRLSNAQLQELTT